jgi:hypothetical protein
VKLPISQAKCHAAQACIMKSLLLGPAEGGAGGEAWEATDRLAYGERRLPRS